MATLTLHGMVDPHVHLRDLDWSHKATFASETRAAIAGGYWAVFDMPNTAPSTISHEALAHKLDKINTTAYCDWGIYYGAARHNWNSHTPDHVCGLKIYNNDTTGDLLIDDQAIREQHYKHWNGLIAVHAEEETVLDILKWVRKYKTHTHFCHINTAFEIKALTAAKKEGLPISIGVTPHHLFLSEDDLPRLGAYGRMKPELKTQQDCDALWDAIRNGIVDVIESDHAPHTIDEKESDAPPYGVPGLETTLPLMLTAVKDRRIDQDRLVDMLTINSHNIFGITPPPETYTVVDLDVSYELTREGFIGACGWSPFDGMKVHGAVREVWIRGTKVYDGEQVLSQPGFGNNLF